MEAFLISLGVVTLAEIGDKTQLLAFILAARFQKPLPIVFAIFVATIFNHALAGAFGNWISLQIDPYWLKWILSGSFLAMAIWTLIPDKIEEKDSLILSKLGVFGTTLVTFFLAEMGDKTQIATAALAAHYSQVVLVISGTTLGMLIADVPAVFIGNTFSEIIPVSLVHKIAACIFLALALVTALGNPLDWITY